MTTLLIDADILAYRSAFGQEVATEVEPGYWTWGCSLDKVKADILNSIEWYKDKLKAEEVILCLSDTTNFRHQISSTYKGNRSWMKRPVVLKPTREWMIEDHNAVIYPGLEGDDVLGILANEPDTIIISIDKDLKTVPGKHWYQDEVHTTNLEQADYWHMYQTLCGDVADGYGGCPGVGPVSAKAILEKGTDWDNIVKTFEKKGLDADYALTQARLARILRHGDYNHETKEPILWTPT